MVKIMKKKSIWFHYSLILILFGTIFFRIYSLNQREHEAYVNRLASKTEIYIEGESAPRGRILDTNGKVLVDNTLVERIVYHKINQPSFEEEIEIAKQLLEIFEVEEAKEKELREYYALKNPNIVQSLVTEEEKKLVEMRKMTKEELEILKRNRIPVEALQELSHQEKMIAFLYHLMNEGYSYQNKIMIKEADSKQVALIGELNIPGIFIDYGWKRIYPYGELLKGVFGTLREGIPEEYKDEYLALGYSLHDIVGASYLEQQYESYLKGEKALYFVNADKSLSLVKEAKRGNDIYLSIDITLQQKLDDVVKQTLIKVKKLPNTEYLKENYALIGDPKTGAIRAMVGQRMLENGKDVMFQEISSNTFLSSFTVGSIVKGASHTVGYLNGVIEEGKKMKDHCVKLYLTPQKCSYKELGYLDDISALKWSSNYYQFNTAIRLTGKQYFYNMKLDADEAVFQKYRNVFSLYGLGSLTGLDIPNEQNGQIGKTMSDDLLLNLTIGQYDTYTPVQLLQYIHTIHTNGERYALSLIQEIRNEFGDVILKPDSRILSKTNLDVHYYERIREGFRQVLMSGTGSGYISKSISAYGKTGTSESFYDSNGDGVVDTKTISSTLAMIAPSQNKLYSLVLVTPNLSHYNGRKDYTAPFNRYISNEMADYLLSYSFS